MVPDMELGLFIDYDEGIVRLLQRLGMNVAFTPRKKATGFIILHEKSETRKA